MHISVLHNVALTRLCSLQHSIGTFAQEARCRYTCAAATRRVAVFYGSYSTADDMAWGAMWLYNATRQQMWLDTVSCEPALIAESALGMPFYACLVCQAAHIKATLLLCVHQQTRQKAWTSQEALKQSYGQATHALYKSQYTTNDGAYPWYFSYGAALPCLGAACQLFISIAPALLLHANAMLAYFVQLNSSLIEMVLNR